jgi:UDP-N-acetylglucosamine--N-acetylmuramyl-(pentapeptide) pyrophosphoryl-undecaprenol N-acetylglucosamine transferase
VYPALAVLQTMQNKAEVLWVGGEGGMEARLVERANVPFKSIPAAGIHGVSLGALPGNILRLVRGFFAARRILNEFRPDVLFFTGGYLAIPMALAGMRIPTALYVPDIEPALALKTLAHFADKIAVTARESFRYFTHPDRLILTGYPTRADLGKWTRSEGRRVLGLTGDSPVLLVLGGSRGARSINNAVLANLSALLDLVQIVHITGELDWSSVKARAEELAGVPASHYHVFPYLHEEMGAALASADLALSRAGASTLGEYPLFSLPAVLVPYPHAWRYQKENADALVRQGAAIMLEDGKLSNQLFTTVIDLLGQPQRLASMRNAMRGLSHPEAAAEIGRQILALCQERTQAHG